MDAPRVHITVEILASELELLRELARREGVSENDIVGRAIVTLKQISDATASGADAVVQRRTADTKGFSGLPDMKGFKGAFKR